ncbi:MAG: FIST C-terminal domain-containing protein [Planctomycetes bacterium]|nr:FIST C-terminal domain-containing protein [Planctomycetota bacterium]
MILKTLQYRKDTGWSDALPELDGKETLVLVFGASSFVDDPEPIAELQRHFGNSIVAGCSTAGEVLGCDINDDTLSVAVAKFEASTLRLATATVDASGESRDAGSRLAEQLLGDDLQGVLLLSDGLLVNGTELVAGLAERLPAGTSITGGLAGDGSRFERTWVVAGNDAPTKGVIAAVGFYGPRIHLGHGTRGGWDSFGPERVVTRSEGNVLFELDGRPALELYKEYLGERAEGLPATALLFPLAIRSGVNEEKSLVRTILAVDEQAQSMTFAGDVPQGWCARLMKANFDRLIDGAAAAAQQTRREDENAVSTLAIAISCVGRRLVLGERTEEEVEATLEGLPHDTQMVGFYSYGEISPFSDGTCDLHNQTMTLTTIQESVT